MKDLANFFVGFVFSYILAAKIAEIKLLSGEQLSPHEAINRYRRDELLALRRPRSHDYLDVLHSHGILKYQGCRADRSQRGHRSNPKSGIFGSKKANLKAAFSGKNQPIILN